MDDVDRVVEALRDGDLGIFATETLWSLSARASDPRAVAKVFAAKGRPEGVPLAVGFPSWGMARQYVRTTPLADDLARRHLPGPLSLVVQRADQHLAHVAPGMATLSVRVPDHDLALAILEQVGPCVMTSANRHGARDPTTRGEVERALPGVPVAGTAVPGATSTVVDVRGKEPVVLRRGAVPIETLRRQ